MMLMGCSAGAVPSTTVGTLPPPSTIVVTTTTIPRPTPLPLCDPPAFVPSVLPAGVMAPEENVDLPADLYTSIEGTSTSVWVDEAGGTRVVLVRGSLPPQDWAGRTVRIDVGGAEGALGTMPDGAWAVAWAESSARCDQYSLIVSPPTTREEVEMVARGLQR